MEGTPSARGLSPAAAPTRSNGLAVHRSPGHYIFYNADAPRPPLYSKSIQIYIMHIFALDAGQHFRRDPVAGAWLAAHRALVAVALPSRSA